MEFTEKNSLRLTVAVSTILSLGLLAGAASTTPDSLGPFGITLWFVGLLFALGGFLAITFYYLKRVVNRRADKKDLFTIALRQGVLTSTWLTALLALNSLRQLGLKDIVLVSLLVGLIEFYFRRSR